MTTNKIRIGLTLAAFLVGLSSVASAQQINSIKQNESTLPSKWRVWNSIYGTNLPTSSGTYVTFPYKVNDIYLVGSVSYINAQSDHNTQWFYTSPTQLNFWPYPQNYGSGTPAAGCYNSPGSFPPIEVCNDVRVCGGGICTPNKSNTFTGSPGF